MEGNKLDIRTDASRFAHLKEKFKSIGMRNRRLRDVISGGYSTSFLQPSISSPKVWTNEISAPQRSLWTSSQNGEYLGPMISLFISRLSRLLTRTKHSMATIDAGNHREIARLPARPVKTNKGKPIKWIDLWFSSRWKIDMIRRPISSKSKWSIRKRTGLGINDTPTMKFEWKWGGTISLSSPKARFRF